MGLRRPRGRARSLLLFEDDRADVLLKRAMPRDVLMNREEVRAFVAMGSGERFAPELVKAFLEVSEAHGLWFALETRHLDRSVMDELRKEHRRPIWWKDERSSNVTHAFDSQSESNVSSSTSDLAA
jgi:hypothetical protein